MTAPDAEAITDRTRAWQVIERISLVLLALSFGLGGLLLVIAPRITDGINEPDEQAIFARAWPLALVLMILVQASVRAAFRKWMAKCALFWPVLALGQVSFWVWMVTRIKTIGTETNAVARGAHLTRTFDRMAAVPLGLTLAWFVVCLGAARLVVRRADSERPYARTKLKTVLGWMAHPWAGYTLLLAALAELAWIAWPCAQLTYSTTKLCAIGAGAVVLVVVARHALDEPERRSFLSRWRGHLLCLLVMTLLLWFPDITVLHYSQASQGSTAADIWIDHYNFYLGPLQAVLAGRSPLVDASSQYGVGVIYVLALIFKIHLFARSAVGLAHLICAAQIFRFFLLYLVLRKISRSLFVSLTFVTLALAVSAFATKYVYIRLPNEGPLRFIVEFVLVAAIAFQWPPRKRRVANLGSLVIVGVGALWSPDVALTVVGAYLGTRALVAWRLPASWWKRAVAFAKDLLAVFVAIAIAAATLQLYTRATAGTWPIWNRAIEYIIYYSTWDVWTVPIDPWSPWVVVALVYAGSLAAVICDGRATVELQVVAAMSLVGISEMTYYVGRSYTENLAAVSLPAVFLGCYWAARVIRATSGTFRFLLAAAAAGCVLLTLLPCLPAGIGKLSYSLLVRTATGEEPPEPTPSVEAQEAANMMTKYYPRRHRVGLFVSEDAEVEALLLSGKTQLWPLSYPPADNFLPRSHDAAMVYWPPLHQGETVFIGSKLDAFQQEIVDRIQKKVKLVEIEKGPAGVRAMRVDPL
jgi:hypothetical protein